MKICNSNYLLSELWNLVYEKIYCSVRCETQLVVVMAMARANACFKVSKEQVLKIRKQSVFGKQKQQYF